MLRAVKEITFNQPDLSFLSNDLVELKEEKIGDL